MNVYDSQKMEQILNPLGYRLCDDMNQADLVIFNTCHIRAKAEDKLFSDLGRAKFLKETRGALLVVAGCVGQALGQQILQKTPYVDAVVGPQTYHYLPETLTKILRQRFEDLSGEGPKKRLGVVATGFPKISKFDSLQDTYHSRGPCAFLSIQEGCDKFCRYCVVPYTRGSEYSRPYEEVLAEAFALMRSGIKEITLLGQNVNAYRGPDSNGTRRNLADLLYALAEYAPECRLRYTTSHPRDMDETLIQAHAKIPSLMPFLHLPVQSGSDRILALMNRQYTSDDYKKVIDRLRQGRPDIAFSSDFIVGYPGETDQDFDQTCRLVREIGYAQAYSFKLSARPGTPAAAAQDPIPEEIKSQRLHTLQDILNEQQKAFNEKMVGQKTSIIIEKRGRRPNQWIGRSPYMQSVHVHSTESLENQKVDVLLVKSHPNSLTGQNISTKDAIKEPAH